jgi:hypothetical protein
MLPVVLLPAEALRPRSASAYHVRAACGHRIASFVRGRQVNLRLIDSAIRFEINVAAGERAGFRISSRLLIPARIVSEVRAS